MDLDNITYTSIKLHMRGFKGVEFGPCSEEALSHYDAVFFARNQGGFLPSMREIAALRIETGEEFGSGLMSATRTTLLHFIKDGEYFTAIDDVADDDLNLGLYLADLEKEEQCFTSPLIVDKKDIRVKATIERAYDTKRLLRTPTDGEKRWGIYRKQPVRKHGKSKHCFPEILEDDFYKALFLDMAEPFEKHVASYAHGFYIRRCTVPMIKWRLTEDTVLVSAPNISYGKLDNKGKNNYITIVQGEIPFGGGWARGVTHKKK